MAKRVKVVLTESIATLGRDGDVVEVAPGYARNFLLPFGKAANVTPSILKQIELKRVGEDGVLFGTVTNGDVAEAIEASTKKNIDRRDITVPDIHNLGSFVAKIKLHQEVNAEVKIEVTS